jgi:hypothetical protein
MRSMGNTIAIELVLGGAAIGKGGELQGFEQAFFDVVAPLVALMVGVDVEDFRFLCMGGGPNECYKE